MCGRYVLSSPMEALEAQFEATATAPFGPRYNLPPTSAVPVVKVTPAGRIITLHHWGLVPSWAKDPALGARLSNARAETVADKPSFRTAFKRNRCLIPADGFYEWQARPGQPKQPFYISAVNGELLAFAGLWEYWEGPDGALESCTIITTQANPFMAPVHERMPVLLARGDYAAWLDPGNRDAAALQALLRPCPEGLLQMVPVSPRVGSVKHDDPSLVEHV